MVECPLCHGAGTVNPDFVSVGDRLRSLRGGEVQSDLAKTIGVSRAQIANLEGGRGLPSIAVLTTYADHFNVSVDWILGRADPKPPRTKATGGTE